MRGRAAQVAIFGVVWLALGLAQVDAAGRTLVTWTQAHFDAAHDGFNPYEAVLSPSNVAGLGAKWIGTGNVLLDEMVNPLVSGTTVYGAGDEAGFSARTWLLAFDQASGQLLWKVQQSADTVTGIATLQTPPARARIPCC